VSSPAFAGFYHDLRGDVFFAQGKLESAAGEYQLAMDLDASGIIDRSFVQIKLDDVRGSIAVTAAESESAEPDIAADSELPPAAAD